MCGKDVVSAGFIPVLVFDCVALQLKEGISGLFPERMDTCFSYALDNVWTLLGSFGIFSSLKKSTWWALHQEA